MINVHVISDYYLGFTEFTTSIDEDLPESDLVIIVGNMGLIKRSMLYVEQLCRKYPTKQFIINVGRTEDGLHQKNNTELSDGLTTRQMVSEFWPSNLHYGHKKPIALTIKEQKLEILCLHGFPHIVDESVDDVVWKSTSWYKYATHGITVDQSEFKLKEAADVYHGWFPKFSTPERCREDHKLEYEVVSEWLSTSNPDVTKVLVTALGPKADPCLQDIDYYMYPDSHPDVWIASGLQIEERIGNTVLYGNPGRSELARKAVLKV